MPEEEDDGFVSDEEDACVIWEWKDVCLGIPIFLAAALAFYYLANGAVQKGDHYRLDYGVDSWGNTCGRNASNIATTKQRVDAGETESHPGWLSPFDLSQKQHLFVTVVSHVETEESNSVNMRVCAENCPYPSLLIAGTGNKMETRNEGIDVYKHIYELHAQREDNEEQVKIKRAKNLETQYFEYYGFYFGTYLCHYQEHRGINPNIERDPRLHAGDKKFGQYAKCAEEASDEHGGRGREFVGYNNQQYSLLYDHRYHNHHCVAEIDLHESSVGFPGHMNVAKVLDGGKLFHRTPNRCYMNKNDYSPGWLIAGDFHFNYWDILVLCGYTFLISLIVVVVLLFSRIYYLAWTVYVLLLIAIIAPFCAIGYTHGKWSEYWENYYTKRFGDKCDTKDWSNGYEQVGSEWVYTDTKDYRQKCICPEIRIADQKECWMSPDHRSPHEEYIIDLWWYYIWVHVAIVPIGVLYVSYMNKHLSRVHHLFCETARILTNVPLVLIQPFLSFCGLIACIYGAIHICTLYVTDIWLTGPCNSKVCKLLDYNKRLGVEKSKVFLNMMNFETRPEIWVSMVKFVILVVFVWQIIFAWNQIIIARTINYWYFGTKNILHGAWSYLKAIVLGSFFNFFTAVWSSLANTIFTPVRELERFIKFLIHFSFGIDVKLNIFWFPLLQFDKRAYSLVAIEEMPYLNAANEWKQYQTINDNNSIAIECKGDAVCILGIMKLGISSVIMCLATSYFQHNPELCYNHLPVIFVGLLSYQIASLVFSLLDMTMETLLMCFNYDQLYSDGIEDPYMMTTEIKKFYNTMNRRYRLHRKGYSTMY